MVKQYTRNHRGRFSKAVSVRHFVKQQAQRVGKLISLKNRVIRAGIHVPVGVGCIFAGAINPFFGWAILITFLAYEVTEDMDIRDGAWYDIVGFLIGLGVGITLWVL